ncbi:tRNA (adenosine(37)-N6)-threonylcarbamoyltransferase complex ATPase subunit type 1 TsaE [Williamsoniiplasma lucivorax]|uniref:tRNA threonylcarbamoyladenosine biosynthesis protein TsaE n=1 Tax=Williamsoniiplasma lucivorax TaxID=209274 RepID=A0A2S5R9W6_9MOLU|nr:tRNA (adenosine(37)-N6)-threonylcarbamoyltransferase complex ATPase subunit type 1 TsaE [Williamsoniiplasma lucivorax]PPE04093.1 tRNA (N6-adenosine(37)-N6)-threonylcarbamoyltransferase complex ATPase TsaE [Williamsoniiplasma lucivorax]
MSEIIIWKSLQDTKAYAKHIAQLIQTEKQPFFLLLKGDLGAGKTTFTKQLLLSLGVQQRVTSPTFVIMNQYQVGELTINHMDAYRLNHTTDLEMYFEQFDQAINIVEWSNNLNVDWSQFKTLTLSIKIIDENTREVEVN